MISMILSILILIWAVVFVPLITIFRSATNKALVKYGDYTLSYEFNLSVPFHQTAKPVNFSKVKSRLAYPLGNYFSDCLIPFLGLFGILLVFSFNYWYLSEPIWDSIVIEDPHMSLTKTEQKVYDFSKRLAKKKFMITLMKFIRGG